MDPDGIDARTFEHHLTALADHFLVLPLDEAIERLCTRSLPARAACITFDDGYADNFEVALPILQRRDMHATFFISTGFLDGGLMWNDSVIEAVRRAAGPLLDLTELDLGRYPVAKIDDRREAAGALISALKYLPAKEREIQAERLVGALSVSLPKTLMLSREQVRSLRRAGMGIGGHTVSHPILARLEDGAARAEIADGRAALEDILGERVTLFAYPNGRPGRDYTAVHVKMVRELGFRAAVSTAWGAARAAADLHQLPRFAPWDVDATRFVLRLLGNYRRAGAVHA